MSETLPRFEGIETPVLVVVTFAISLSETLPRFEGIETHLDSFDRVLHNWSETLPRFEGIETPKVCVRHAAPSMSETLPRFEGIETQFDFYLTLFVVCLKHCPDLRGLRRIIAPMGEIPMCQDSCRLGQGRGKHHRSREGRGGPQGNGSKKYFLKLDDLFSGRPCFDPAFGLFPVPVLAKSLKKSMDDSTHWENINQHTLKTKTFRVSPGTIFKIRKNRHPFSIECILNKRPIFN